MEKIELAKKMVKNVDESYKIAAFQVLFANYLNSNYTSENLIVNNSFKKSATQKDENVISQKNKEKIAKKCKIEISKLDEIFDFEDESIYLIAPLNVNNTQKTVISIACVLFCNKIGLNRSKIEAKESHPSLKRLNVNPKNFYQIIMRHQKLFRKHGKGKFATYSLTDKGENYIIEKIQKLANGEQI